MKRFATVLAVFALVACSDATAPTFDSKDVSPGFGRAVPPAAGAAGSLTWAKFDFAGQSLTATNGGGGGANGATIGATVLEGVAAASSSTPLPIYTQPTNYFMGRFSNTQTVVMLNVPNGGSTYSLQFDFYAIGSWDGLGKQAQSGLFGANLFQIGAMCAANPGVVVDIFTSTFSNQMTVQQNYPLAAGSTGGAKALTGSFASDNLFKNDLTVPVPEFRSVSDATYKLSFGGQNPCGSGAFSLVFRSYSPSQQSAFDETWGVDNIVVKTDN